MTDLSIPEKMNRVYLYVQAHTSRTGFSPSIREIADGCDLSLNAVFRYLRRLEDQGRVARIPGQARSIRALPPVPNPPDAAPVPEQSGCPPGWCAGSFCPVLALWLALLFESVFEQGGASAHE
jgi:SOS-response transcriptional repressor LexA